MNKKILSAILPILVLSGVLVAGIYPSYALLTNKSQTKRHPPERVAPLVEVGRFVPGSVVQQVSTVGRVVPSKEVALQAEVSGPLDFVSDKLVPGAVLEKGAQLFRLNTRELKSTLAARKEAMANAELALKQEQGRVEIARLESGYIDDTLTPLSEALMHRRPQLAAAEATFESARQAWLTAREDLKKAVITAPFNARVASRPLETGQFVNRGNTTLVELVASDSAWIEIAISQQELARLYAGKDLDKNQVAISHPDWEASRAGRILSILPGVETGSQQVRLLIEVLDPFSLQASASASASASAPALTLSSLVDVAISGKTIDKVIAVPEKAFHQGALYTLNEDRLAIRQVTPHYRAADLIYLRQQEPVEVVLSPLPSAVEGMALRRAAE